MRSKSLVFLIVALAFVATNAFAVGEGRMNGKILDATTKKPILDAVIKISAMEKLNFNTEVKGNKKGEWAFFALDATIKYKFVVSAPGYAPHEEVIKIPIGVATLKNFELKTGSAEGQQMVMTERADPAVDAYNAGVVLVNSGDLKGAAAKFSEAVTIKPELTAGWIALAKMSEKLKDYPKAIEAANKVVEIDDEDSEMWAVLARSYAATGDKAKAAAAEAKLPKNAGALFNEAANVINKGNDTEGEKLLKQAIAADPKMAIAYYELGMIYVRSGKGPEAKTNLQKYLELEPNGKDAAVAKEMMSYIK